MQIGGMNSVSGAHRQDALASGAARGSGRERRERRYARLRRARPEGLRRSATRCDMSSATLTAPARPARRISRSRAAGPAASAHESSPFEITPSGNGVTLEDEMMKVAGNDMDYQAVTALYTRSLRLLKTAIGLGKQDPDHDRLPLVAQDRRNRPARPECAHAGHRREHRQRGFRRQDAGRGSLSSQDPDLQGGDGRRGRPRSSRSARSPSTSPTSRAATSRAIRRPMPMAM